MWHTGDPWVNGEGWAPGRRAAPCPVSKAFCERKRAEKETRKQAVITFRAGSGACPSFVPTAE